MNRIAGSVVLLLLLATSASALERSTAVFDRAQADPWGASATCTVHYWNVCTGWLWVWSAEPGDESPHPNWGHQDVLGQVYDSCHESCVLEATQVYAWSGAPSDYGHTGFVRISTADANGCPDVTLAEQSYLPVSGATQFLWDLPVPDRIVMQVILWADDPREADLNQSVWPTDRPAQGPTGPQALGLCYPSTRETRSFYYGTLDSPFCPGSPFADDVGNAELLLWSAQFRCPVSVDARSWGNVKALYR